MICITFGLPEREGYHLIRDGFFSKIEELRLSDGLLDWFLQNADGKDDLRRLQVYVNEDTSTWTTPDEPSTDDGLYHGWNEKSGLTLFRGPLLDDADDYTMLTSYFDLRKYRFPSLVLLRLSAAEPRPVKVSSRAVVNLGVHLTLLCSWGRAMLPDPRHATSMLRAVLLLSGVEFATKGVHLALPAMFSGGIMGLKVRRFPSST